MYIVHVFVNWTFIVQSINHLSSFKSD